MDSSYWDDHNLYKIYFGLYGILCNQGQCDSAKVYVENSLKIAEKMDDADLIMRSKEALAFSYSNQGKFFEAINICLEMLKLAEQLQDAERLHALYCTLGSLSLSQKEINLSELYYKKAIALQKTNENFFNAISERVVPYINLGIIYLENKNFSEALNHASKTIEIAKQLLNHQDMANGLQLRAKTFAMLGEFEKADLDFQEAIEISKKSQNQGVFHDAILEYGLFILRSFNQEKINGHELKKAGDFCNRAFSYYKDSGNLKSVRSCLQCLYEYYKIKGDFKKSLKFYEKHIALKDSIINRENKVYLENQLLKFEFEKKELIAKNEINELTLERELHKSQIQSSRNWIAAIILALVTSLFGLFFVGYRNTQRKKLNASIQIKNDTLALLHQKTVEKNELLTLHNEETKEKNKILEAELKTKLMLLMDQQNIHEILKDKIANLALSSKEKKDLIRVITRENNSELIAELEDQFLGVHEDFVKALSIQFPNLTPNNIKLSLLIKLNLSSKEIAQLMHISYQGARVAQTRLRKKLGLSSDQKLSTFLNSIEYEFKKSDDIADQRGDEQE